MKCLLCGTLASLLLVQAHAQSVLFQQDFSAGNTTNSYVGNTSGNKTLFTSIDGTVSGATCPDGTSTATISTDGRLEFYRPRSCSGDVVASRSIDFSPVPQTIYAQFSLEVSSLNDGLSPAFICFGSNGPNNSYNDNGTYRNAETFAKVTIGFPNAVPGSNQFNLRDVDNKVTSATFSGKQLITIILNASGYRIKYLQPGGGVRQLETGLFEVWVGSTIALISRPAISPSIELRRFKVDFNGSGVYGHIWFDDFLIRDVSGSLPVTLTHFGGKAQGPQIDLAWTTATEHTSDLFTVERSADGQEFQAIGSVRAVGDNDSPHTYGFSDPAPTTGTNYYRLRQTDRDGITTFSKLIAVPYESGNTALLLLSNPATPDGIRVRSYVLDNPTYRLYTLTGQQIELATFPQSDDSVWLKPVVETLPVGIYLLTVQSGSTRLTRQVLIR